MTMKTILCLAVILIAVPIASDAQLICIPDSEFCFPSGVQAGVTCSFHVSFDVVSRSAKNIRIESFPHWQEPEELFELPIRENLGKLYFRSDTTAVSIDVIFSFARPGRLSRSYADMPSSRVLRFICPTDSVPPFYNICALNPRIVDPNSDSSTLELSLPFEGSMRAPSDILVRRLFIGDRDSTIIIRNNCPTYEPAILRAAAQRSIDDFLYTTPNATQFFIRFRILHYSRQCLCTELL